MSITGYFPPTITFNTLPHADGSVTYEGQGYTVVGAVNGPLEAQRRDELPDEAFLEVNLRQASGPGGPRERHIESLLHSTLRSLILTTQHPRTLIQLTLQILRAPASSSPSAPIPQTSSHLPSLTPLLHASVLALLNGNIPMRDIATGALISIPQDEKYKGEFHQNCFSRQIDAHDEDRFAKAVWKSSHFVAFSSKGEVLLAESEGEFTIDEWEVAVERASYRALGTEIGGTNYDPEDEDVVHHHRIIRHAIEQETTKTMRWKGGV